MTLVFKMVSGSSLTNFHGMMLKKPVTTNGKVDTGPNTESTISAELKILNTNWWKKEVWSSFKVWPSMMSLMKKTFVYMREGKVLLSMHASKYYTKSILFCDIYLPKCWDYLSLHNKWSLSWSFLLIHVLSFQPKNKMLWQWGVICQRSSNQKDRLPKWSLWQNK